MATPTTRWLLSILLVTLPRCCAAEGPPAPPSPPECYRPCDEKHCSSDIQCIWDQTPDPKVPSNCSLHYQSANSEEEHPTSGTSLNGFILREHFSRHGELRVWVQARNRHGSAKSQEVVFNVEDIIKPPRPKFSSSQHEPLEIHWNTACGQLQLSIGSCDVRHRTEEDQAWPEWECGLHISYTLVDPLPGTAYEFQVRCSCHTGLMSDWSAIHRVKSAESAPVGEVDVWRDCGLSPASLDCFLTWKNLSGSQARGLILGYEVRLSYYNGTVALMNVSAAEPSSQFAYDEMKWCLSSSLKDVSSASVSAYNALGATVPSYLAVPQTGKEENGQDIHLQMNEEHLSVSWDPPSQFSDNQNEYVVQYKQAGCPAGRGLDWIKVNKSQKTVGFFKGQFKKYTAYQVSLFQVSSSREVHHLSSVIGYSHQRAPSTVPSFQVFSIDATDVTLFWEPVPLTKQNGLFLYYQIGVGAQRVYNVSASPKHENQTFKLQHLSPGREYEVWIRAANAAGPGANVTTRFITKHGEGFAHLIPLLLGIVFLFIVICFSAVLFSACRGENKSCPLVPRCLIVKVPDPRNSHIFRQMKHQINEPLAWICIPINEPHPKISLLEVVEMKSQAFDPDGLTGPAVGNGCSQMDCQDDRRDGAVTEERDRTGREEYSKMVDSDEEREDCWSSSEEEQITSGYEKHFMPTAMEILEV